jgi:hypothetical protein
MEILVEVERKYPYAGANMIGTFFPELNYGMPRRQRGRTWQKMRRRGGRHGRKARTTPDKIMTAFKHLKVALYLLLLQ